MDVPVATRSAIEANVSAVVESCSDAVSATGVIDIEADRFGATVLVVSELPAAIDPGSLLGSS